MASFSILSGIVAFLLGISFGSFLNVCSYRLPREQPVVWTRSQCPSCKNPIEWYDNIPIVSFLVLGGRCRHCDDRISGSYLVGEIVGGIVSVGCFLWWSSGYQIDWINYLVTTFLILISYVITRIDWEFSIIPNEITYGLIIGGLLLGFVPHYPYVATSSMNLSLNQGLLALTGALIGGGIFFLLAVLSPLIYGRPALGMGDVKLMAGYGAWLGPKLILLTIVLGSIVGALIGSALMLIKGKSLRTEIPFGPFLCLGAVVALLWGGPIIHWYLNLL